MARSGSSTPSFSSAMAGSFQVVICSAKMPAMTSAVMLSESMPSSWKITAIGEM
jgi:hypothetical protein